jgi:hypothetical protein
MGQINEHSGSEVSSVLHKVMWIYFYSTIVYILYRLARDYRDAGDSWKQGDWLINSNMESIRRGLLGSGILNLSDSSGLSPLLLTVLLQATLFIVFAVAIGLILAKSRGSKFSNINWLLFAPFFALIFWGNDPYGSFRKELFFYASIGLLILSQFSQRRFEFALQVLAIVVIVLGQAAHEINSLMMPVFLFCLYCSSDQARKQKYIAMALSIIAISFIPIYYNIHFSTVSSVNNVCLPLIEHGFSSEFCGGAITALTQTQAEAHQTVLEKISKGEMGYFVFFYMASMLTALMFAYHTKQFKTVLIIYLLTAIPLLPLYFVAVDYGRWLTTHFAAFVFCVFFMLKSGMLNQKVAIPKNLVIAMLVISPLLSPAHILGRSNSKLIVPILLGGILYFSYVAIRKSLLGSSKAA